MPGNFTVFKDAKGHYRWVTISSSAYKDRDNEIVSTKALVDDCDRADLDHDYGPLRWWHVPNLDVGDCDFNMMNGRLLIESGTFRDERIGEILKEASDDYEVSLGFKHPITEPDRDKVFHSIRRFERSILPAGRASNPLTLFMVKGDENMATLEEKKEALKALLGDSALTDSLLQKAASRDKEAEKSGMAFKATREDGAKASKKEEEADDGDDIDLDDLLAELDSEDEDENAGDTADETESKETTKAKKLPAKMLAHKFPKKGAKKLPVDEEENPDETEPDADTDDEENMDEEDMADEEEKEAGEVATFLGDIPTDTFASLMAEALSTALEPYFMQLKEIGQAIKEVQTLSVTNKETQATALAQTTKAVETQGEELVKLRKAAETQAAALAKTQKRVKELEEGVTPAAKGYIASQDTETVVKEGAPILTQVPKSDPLADFTNFVIGQSGQAV